MMRWYTCEELLDLAAPYVLGALEPDEEAAVRAGLGACPEAMAEVDRLGGVVPYLAASVEPLEPPAALRGRILAAAAADLEARPRPIDAAGRPAPSPIAGTARTAGASPPAPHTAFPPAPEPAPRAAARPRPWLQWGLAAAAVLVIAALGLWNLSLRGQLDIVEAYATAAREVAAAAAEPGAQIAVIGSGTADGPRGLGSVTADGSVVLAIAGLEPTSGASVYAAWMIGAAGAPIPIGEFTVGADGVGYLPDGQGPTEPGVTLALTLEARAGATTPSLPPVAAGTARPGPTTQG